MCCIVGLSLEKAKICWWGVEKEIRGFFVKPSTLPHVFRRRIKAKAADPPCRAKRPGTGVVWLCEIGIREALQLPTLAQGKIPFFIHTFYCENLSNTKLLEAVVGGVLLRAGTPNLFLSIPAHLTLYYGPHLLSDILSPTPAVCNGIIPNAASVIIFSCLYSSVKVTLLFTSQRISSWCHLWGLS